MLKLSFFHRDPTKTSVTRIQRDEEKLQQQFEKLSKEVEDLERQTEYALDQIKSKRSMSRREEELLTLRLQQLGDTAKMKRLACTEVQSHLLAVSNWRIRRETEQDIKAAETLDQLLNLPSGKLEHYLNEKRLDAEDRGSALKDITGLTKKALEVSAASGESLEDIRKVILAVREGSLEPNTAAKQITKKPLQVE